MIDRLAYALTIGSELTAEEILDVLWLSAIHAASHSTAPDAEIPKSAAPLDRDGQERPVPDLPENATATPASPGTPAISSVAMPEQDGGRLVLRTGGGHPGPGEEHAQVPASEVGFGSPRPIRDALALPRALRRFRQVRAPARRFMVDIDATVTATAEAGGRIVPRFTRPLERILDLALVVDGSPSMRIWDDTFDEFQRLLLQTGAFRSLSQWRLTVHDGEVSIEDPSGTPHPPGRLIDPSGRRIVFVATNASGESWYTAAPWDAVASWSEAMPTAVIQVLPRHYWAGTALGEPYVTARACRPAAPNSEYAHRLAWWAQDPGGVVLPVVTLAPESLETWAQAVVSGTAWTAAITATPPEPEYAPSALVGQVDADVVVSDFLSRASPGAELLARILASASALSMPLISVLQNDLAPETGVLELAEVLSSNLLHDAGGQGDRHLFRFLPGTREILQRGLTTFEERDTYAAVSRYLDARHRLGGQLQALVPDPEGSALADPAEQPFAELQEALAARLGLLTRLRLLSVAPREGLTCPICLYEIMDWDSQGLWEYTNDGDYVEIRIPPDATPVQRYRYRLGAYVRCPSTEGDQTAVHHYLPARYAQFGAPVLLGFVGLRQSGKSHLLASMVAEIGRLSEHRIEVQALDPALHHQFVERAVKPLIARSEVLPGTPDDKSTTLADAFIVRHGGGPERVVALFDVSGGILAQAGSKKKEFLFIADGLFFVVDPEKIRTSRAGDDTFTNVLTIVRAREDRDAVSAVIVLNKADKVRFEEPASRWLRFDDLSVNPETFLRESADVYAYLERGAPGVLTEPYQVCRRATLHVASATGGSKEGEDKGSKYPRGVTPAGVLRPMIAMLAMTGVLTGPQAEKVGV